MILIPGRIPIYIHPFFWLLILMIGWMNSSSLLGTAIWSVVIFFSVLIHEYGHALTAGLFGQKAEINLVGLGGLTKREGPRLQRWKEFIIVFNGPLAGFLIFLLSYQVLERMHIQSPVFIYALQVSVNVNFFWTILNLLPVLPLDGGHLMRILLEGAWGVNGTKWAFLTSVILASFIALSFFLIQQMLMGALLFMLAFESYRGWTEIKSMSAEDTDEALQELVNEGIKELKEGRDSEALAKFIHVRKQAPKGLLYVIATQYAAHILVEMGSFKQAYDWLYPLKNRLSVEYKTLLQQLAYRIQEWEEAVKIGQEIYQENPSIEVALINATCYAIIGEAKPSVGWLRAAAELGLPNIFQVIEKREFDSIRNTKVFQEWLRGLKQV